MEARLETKDGGEREPHVDREDAWSAPLMAHNFDPRDSDYVANNMTQKPPGYYTFAKRSLMLRKAFTLLVRAIDCVIVYEILPNAEYTKYITKTLNGEPVVCDNVSELLARCQERYTFWELRSSGKKEEKGENYEDDNDDDDLYEEGKDVFEISTAERPSWPTKRDGNSHLCDKEMCRTKRGQEDKGESDDPEANKGKKEGHEDTSDDTVRRLEKIQLFNEKKPESVQRAFEQCGDTYRECRAREAEEGRKRLTKNRTIPEPRVCSSPLFAHRSGLGRSPTNPPRSPPWSERRTEKLSPASGKGASPPRSERGKRYLAPTFSRNPPAPLLPSSPPTFPRSEHVKRYLALNFSESPTPPSSPSPPSERGNRYLSPTRSRSPAPPQPTVLKREKDKEKRQQALIRSPTPRSVRGKSTYSSTISMCFASPKFRTDSNLEALLKRDKEHPRYLEGLEQKSNAQMLGEESRLDKKNKEYDDGASDSDYTERN